MTETPALKPCPFCGGAWVRCGQYFMPGSPDWRVLCMNDECAIGPFCDFNTEADAIAAWNRRLSPKPDICCRDEYHNGHDCMPITQKPTHWMPLPAPPPVDVPWTDEGPGWDMVPE